jgi:hypothetical protein
MIHNSKTPQMKEPGLETKMAKNKKENQEVQETPREMVAPRNISGLNISESFQVNMSPLGGNDEKVVINIPVLSAISSVAVARELQRLLEVFGSKIEKLEAAFDSLQVDEETNTVTMDEVFALRVQSLILGVKKDFSDMLKASSILA